MKPHPADKCNYNNVFKDEILLDKEIIRVYGINPKLWKFDEFKFQKMDEEDDVYRLLCNFDDVDFDRYFSYN